MALHHLLPDLIPPIDRAYTGRFFAWPKSSFQARPREILREALTVYTQWARPCRPDRLVGSGWRTSATNILEHATIASGRVEHLTHAA